MKTFRKSIVIFLLFMIGTMSAVHVDRQCAAIEGSVDSGLSRALEKLENFIEK